MSTSPISLPKKLKIAQLFGERNTYRLIATKTMTSKSTVHRVIELINSEEVEEHTFDYKKQLIYHYVLFSSIQDPFITNKLLSQKSADFEFCKSITKFFLKIVKN